MAITDQLTGLHNRRYMSRHLDNLVETAKKTGKPIAFVIMDIDYFKSVNDTHGHDIGDEVLKEFASRMPPMCAALTWPAAMAARNSWW